MLIVTQGIVDGVRKGGELSGLAPEQEARLIAEGVCVRPGDVPDAGPDETATGEPMSAAQLKARCKELGLPTSGKKDDLIARIAEAEAAEAEEPEGDEPPVFEAEVPR